MNDVTHIKLRGTFLAFMMLSLFSLEVHAQESWERNIISGKEKVRIISYNILNGFSNLKDTDRVERFVSWVKEKDPEVVALQELTGFKQADLEKLAKQYGHPYAVILKENGYPVGLTSKKPIVRENRITEGFWHGVLHANTYGIDMMVVHLSPADWKYRQREAKAICKYIEEQKLEKYMIMGDFNAHSPHDADELETHTGLIHTTIMRDAKSKQSQNMRDGRFDYSTLSIFLSRPLEDVCRMFVEAKKRTTFPARILSHWYKNENLHTNRGERLDYILVSPNLLDSCVEGMIWNGEDTDYLSDHYPIGIDIMLEI